MKIKTIRLSICECGFPVLRDDVPVGTEYEVDMDRRSSGKLICGGCKRTIDTTLVFVESNTVGRSSGYLPLGIFRETPTAPVKAVKPNCYECQYRRDLPGNAHSQCVHPKVGEPFPALLSAILDTPFGPHNALGITADPHGISKGWFAWPIDFDPTWLQTCNGFTKKQPLK